MLLIGGLVSGKLMPNRLSGARNYTLIELLVAIMVISILASLLMPSLDSAHEASNSSTCASNLRQIGLGVSRLYMNKRFPVPLDPFWKEGEVVSREGSFDIYYAHFPPPLPPPPPPPETTESKSKGSSSNGGKLDSEELFELMSLGCPNVDNNLGYEIDPINEPEFRSFSFLKFNEKRTYRGSWGWLLSESNFSTIEDPSQLSEKRHEGKVNLYFKDGHIEFSEIENVDFPEKI